MASRPPPRAGRKVESPGGPPIPPPALTVRFAGDAGDGVTLLGARLAAAGRAGYAVATRADPPGEIRSVPGAQAGVHAVQVRVGPPPALVPGPAADLLVALNPAAAAVYGPLLSPGGEVVVNTDAGPVPPGPARGWPLTTLTRAAVAPCKLSARDAGRCTHFFVLGVTLAYAGLPADEALGWVRRTLADNPPAADAAGRAVRAGLAFGTDQRGVRAGRQARAARSEPARVPAVVRPGRGRRRPDDRRRPGRGAAGRRRVPGPADRGPVGRVRPPGVPPARGPGDGRRRPRRGRPGGRVRRGRSESQSRPATA